VYINDLPLNIQEVEVVLYADDINILVIDNKEEALQSKLAYVTKKLELWFFMSDLIVNTSKTVAMSFYLCPSNSPCKPCIVLFNTDITYKSKVKFLGMYITDNLSWKVHICTGVII
jgi:hypothetical protein